VTEAHPDPPARSPEAQLHTSRRGPGGDFAISPHHLASRAALDVMAGGGNAVDGAVAANAVLGVVAPDTCGMGGDLFALIHRPGEERPLALNASGCAGSGTTAGDLRATGLDEIPFRSPWTITVPGCVDGWTALLERSGTLSMERVLEPAIRFAEEGFAVSPELASSLARMREVLQNQGSAPPLYPGGAAPRAGDVIRRPRLAQTMREVAAAGRDAFYLGAVGRGITDATQGTITTQDLAIDQAEWVVPIGATVFGATGWTIPPNSQGYLTLAACWIAEQLYDGTDPDDPGYAHALIEGYRAVAWERDDLVTDPNTAPLAPDVLLAAARLRPRVDELDADRVTRWPAARPAPGGTAFLCTRDRDGMGVALIQSNFFGIGAGISAADTGVFLHNRGAGFNLIPGHANEYTPGRRPLHTLSPTLWTHDGRLRMLLGTRGGQYQPQLLAQAAAHHLLAGDDPAAAQHRARWLVDGWRPGEDPSLRVESRMPGPVVDGLRRRGHHVEPTAPWMPGWGPISLLTVDGDEVTAAADPRITTSAAVSNDTRAD
jgi:gamma-glutamyltranspeptidase/glutathione hydrolase